MTSNFTQALQTFGDDAEYIQVVGSGKDALIAELSRLAKITVADAKVRYALD